MSHPLIVNLKKYIDGANLEFLMEVIFHEVLHVLLTDNWKVWPTNEIKRHSGNPIVAAHLHLMSLECSTHLQLGNDTRLKEIDLWYEKIEDGYEKAWAIARQDDFRKDLIEELRDPSQWGKINAEISVSPAAPLNNIHPHI